VRLLIVRHGETVDNIARRIQGQAPGELTDEGYRQARALSARLKDEPLDLIICSDLRRSVQTTEILAAGHACPVVHEPLLRERGFGDLVGAPYDTYQKLLAASGETFFDFRPPGGESLGDLEVRCRKFIEQRNEIWKHQTVLVSAHIQINRMLLRLFLKTPIESWYDVNQDNCCINELEGESADSMRQVLINCIRHLPEKPTDPPFSAG
jgi:broad specificity phosphatase PhoE